MGIKIEDLLKYIALDRPKPKTHSKEKPSKLEVLVKQSQVSDIEQAVDNQKFEFSFQKPTKSDSFEIKFESKDGKEKYSVSDKSSFLEIEKESNQSDYSISLKYESETQTYKVTYFAPYEVNLEKQRQDFTSRVDKFMDTLPKTVMGGVLGFTYLYSGKMTIRDDLIGSMREMVQVHEAIHTVDEYETRVLTSWILDFKTPKYKK